MRSWDPAAHGSDESVAAGLGAALPLLLLVAYNLGTTGHIFTPAYDHIREIEYKPAPELYHADWGTEDPRYILVNAPVMLLWLPVHALLPTTRPASRPAPDPSTSLFDPTARWCARTRWA